jgi:phosphocarrier protein
MEVIALLEKSFVIKNETGLHARPASQFVQKAISFKSSIKVRKDNKEANAKSIISVLSLGAGMGSEITLVIDGIDEQEAGDSLIALLDSFDE